MVAEAAVLSPPGHTDPVGRVADTPDSVRGDPHAAWALAPLIAGQPAFRTGRWIRGKFQYPGSPTRISTALPAAPAAVLVHGTDGSVATLCLDLDTSRAAQAVVDADAERLGALLTECGLRFVHDISPSGGRHLYVPLAGRLPGPEARELVDALARLAPSLDPSPHQNPSTGCIRVPGSVHKRGGHQMLLTPLHTAYDILRRRNAPAGLARLRRALAPELRRGREQAARRTALLNRTPATGPLCSGQAPAAPLRRGWQSPLRAAAVTGLYDTARYPSDSEARMAVLTHLAGCGWTLDQVRGELTGQFPGLAALYQSPRQLEKLLEPEWAKALKWTSDSAGKRSTRKSDTSQPEPTGGAASRASIHQLVNDLENVLYAVLDVRLASLGREGLGLRFLLRAVLAYMRTKETDVLDVGCRTFAAALGKHHGTIARLLPRLAALSDGMVTRIAQARHKNADVYLIALPDRHRDLARELSWRKGKIFGVRPVFRKLGDAAALAYEAIERARDTPTTADIARHAHLSRTTAEKVLTEMAGYGMVHRDTALGWHITHTTSLPRLARRLGVDEDVAAQITLHRHQRAAWHAYLDRHNPTDSPTEAEIDDPERDEYWLPPDDAAMSALWAAA